MLVAWIGAASVGILLARYFKQTWVGSSLCGKDQWFAVCRNKWNTKTEMLIMRINFSGIDFL